MLILIILGVLLVLGIVMIVLGNKNDPGALFGGGVTCITLSVFGFVLAIAFILMVQIPKEKDFQNKQYEKQVLEYRLEHLEDNVVGSEMLYSEIIEFNNNLRTCKHYADSLWVGLFYNDKIATIDYIVIGEEL